MSLHTPGKMVVKENGDANSYALLDDTGNWFMSILLNGEQVTERQRANIERMAVCWNAHDELVAALQGLLRCQTNIRQAILLNNGNPICKAIAALEKAHIAESEQ